MCQATPSSLIHFTSTKERLQGNALSRAMDAVTLLGVIAGLLTSTGFVPQLVKGYRTKKMQDVSFLMPAVLGFGMALWLVYGIIREDAAIIFANSLGVSLTAGLCLMKLSYENRTHS
jgi:MtN3 and saliva related transmembrane protein